MQRKYLRLKVTEDLTLHNCSYQYQYQIIIHTYKCVNARYKVKKGYRMRNIYLNTLIMINITDNLR